jgi:hypothetical protein
MTSAHITIDKGASEKSKQAAKELTNVLNASDIYAVAEEEANLTTGDKIDIAIGIKP